MQIPSMSSKQRGEGGRVIHSSVSVIRCVFMDAVLTASRGNSSTFASQGRRCFVFVCIIFSRLRAIEGSKRIRRCQK